MYVVWPWFVPLYVIVIAIGIYYIKSILDLNAKERRLTEYLRKTRKY